jgi:hypothetical protein
MVTWLWVVAQQQQLLSLVVVGESPKPSYGCLGRYVIIANAEIAFTNF